MYGVGIGGIKTFEDEVTNYATRREEGPKFNPFFIPKMIADIVLLEKKSEKETTILFSFQSMVSHNVETKGKEINR